MCKCCGRGKGLCPVSFGLAVGLVLGIAALIMPQFTQLAMPVYDDWVAAGIMFLKGLVGGFFVALIYDLIKCCCRARCCVDKDKTCSCACSCCSKDKDNSAVVK